MSMIHHTRPWSDYLQAKVEKYKWDESKIQSLQQELIKEQKRRNGITNEMTENLFGFAHGGAEARKARTLVSIAYDVHILGDYTPDNKDFDGLGPLSSTIGDIINNLRDLDQEGSKSMVKQIQKISRENISDQEKALRILDVLKHGFRTILRKHKDSRIRRYVMKDEYSPS